MKFTKMEQLVLLQALDWYRGRMLTLAAEDEAEGYRALAAAARDAAARADALTDRVVREVGNDE